MAGGDGAYPDALIGRPGGGLAGRTGAIPDESDTGGAAEVAKVLRDRPLPNDPAILRTVCGGTLEKSAGGAAGDSSSPAWTDEPPPTLEDK
jgi:hypothetical protein